jgi:hypothetical protein
LKAAWLAKADSQKTVKTASTVSMACGSASALVRSNRGVITRNIHAGMDKKTCELEESSQNGHPVHTDGEAEAGRPQGAWATYHRKRPRIVSHNDRAAGFEYDDLQAEDYKGEDDLEGVEAELDTGDVLGVPLQVLEHHLVDRLAVETSPKKVRS